MPVDILEVWKKGNPGKQWLWEWSLHAYTRYKSLGNFRYRSFSIWIYPEIHHALKQYEQLFFINYHYRPLSNLCFNDTNLSFKNEQLYVSGNSLFSPELTLPPQTQYIPPSDVLCTFPWTWKSCLTIALSGWARLFSSASGLAMVKVCWVVFSMMGCIRCFCSMPHPV